MKVTGLGLGGTAILCIGDVAAIAAKFGSDGGTGQLSLTPASGCGWYVQPNRSFLQVTGGSGTGTASVNFTVSANPNSNPRFGSLSELGRLIHIAQAGTRTTAPFDDVPLTHSYASQITQMQIQGITSGCGATIYCPDDSTTRGQMAVFIIRSLFGDTFPYPSAQYFTDVPTSHRYFKYIQKMRELGITV